MNGKFPVQIKREGVIPFKKNTKVFVESFSPSLQVRSRYNGKLTEVITNY